MRLEHYMEAIRSRRTPEEAPDSLEPGGFTWPGSWEWDEAQRARSECCDEHNLWCVVDRRWTKELAGWVAGRRVLEVMAGNGWLARALSEHGVEVVATDDMSWKNGKRYRAPVFDIKAWDAVDAVNRFEAQVLLVSWPPYDDDAVCRACEAWGPTRPVVYVGEGQGGCNAPDEFFRWFWRMDDAPDFYMASWHGIHDYVQIGYYRKEQDE